jgi:prepilin signal peptidase PulO-like enzyme (type II secretory pathway)
MILVYIFAFVFGAVLGSFAHLVADRLRVKTIWGGRSECLSCSHTLTAAELIPIYSYLAQKGKCKHCHAKLSPWYMWSEITCGVLVAILAYIIPTLSTHVLYANPLVQLGAFVFFSITIALSLSITVYDIRHSVVPLEIVLILLTMGMFATVVRTYLYGFNAYDFFSGAIVALPFALLHILSKGRWVGMGDVFVYAAFGFLLGLPMGTSTFFYSVWLGAFVSLALMMIHRKDYGLKSEIPFTPFIIIAAYLVFFTHTDILNLHDMLY